MNWAQQPCLATLVCLKLKAVDAYKNNPGAGVLEIPHCRLGLHTIPWRGFEVGIQNVPDFKLVCSLKHRISDFEQSLKFQLLKNWDYHLTNLGGRGSGILKRALNILYMMRLLLLLRRNRQSRASVVSMHHIPSLWLHSFTRIWRKQPKGARTSPLVSSFRPPLSPSFPFQNIFF